VGVDVRLADVRGADAVVALQRSSADTVAAVASRLHPRLILAPSGTRIGHVVTPADGEVARAGALRLEFHAVGARLEVDIRRAR